MIILCFILLRIIYLEGLDTMLNSLEMTQVKIGCLIIHIGQEMATTVVV